jgi:UDP-3-O-[3-hydroxymyristoyl] N-acetylglucosamine deacetylase
MIKKCTIERAVSLAGVGIHSGQQVRLTLKPSDSGELVFRRTDLDGSAVPFDPRSVDTGNRSALVSGGGSVQTVEHLLAVLFVLGLDSLDIEVEGGEIPIFDGSARPLASALSKAGVQALPQDKVVARIVRPLCVEEAGASLRISPDEDFRISYRIDFPHPAVGVQSLSLSLTRQAFLGEIAPARTFGFLKDVTELWRKGLALGGGLDNALVLDEEKVINGPLRFPDEFVRHKILDLIGDLALFGRPLLGHFQADRAGHALHVRAVRLLADTPDSWVPETAAVPRYLCDEAGLPCQRPPSALK